MIRIGLTQYIYSVVAYGNLVIGGRPVAVPGVCPGLGFITRKPQHEFFRRKKKNPSQKAWVLSLVGSVRRLSLRDFG